MGGDRIQATMVFEKLEWQLQTQQLWISDLNTAEDFSVVQKEGRRNVIRRTKFYNLDAIKKSAKS